MDEIAEKRIKILLVEDDPNLGFILQESLELPGYAVTRCEDGEAAHAAISKAAFDLCLVDVMLPKMDGFTLARHIRATDEDLPIIFLTAKSMKEDRIEGFKIGGDDYICKPFSMEELMLRIQAVLKRRLKSDRSDQSPGAISIGRFVFDAERRLLVGGAVEHKLTHKESELLKLLCRHRNSILRREIALKAIWGEDTFFAGRSMDVYISKLRKVLSQDERIQILNVHGTGFKLCVRPAE